LAISGFIGFDHSNRYFSEAQLDVIAGGGTMIFAQDFENQPLYIRHQLTTDLSSIKFQEYSVTKNVDFMAKYLRGQFRPYLGQYNITENTLDILKTTAEAAVKFFKDTNSFSRIGGNIRNGSLLSIAEDETQIDTVRMRFGFTIPIPLNNLDITLEV
jgi:hypothetical protein